MTEYTSENIRELIAICEENATIDRQIFVVSREGDFTVRTLLGILLDATERLEALERWVRKQNGMPEG